LDIAGLKGCKRGTKDKKVKRKGNPCLALEQWLIEGEMDNSPVPKNWWKGEGGTI